MAAIDQIQEVEIGSAATFRNTINNNFNIIKREWTGVYIGNNETEANNKLKIGGIWVVVQSDE